MSDKRTTNTKIARTILHPNSTADPVMAYLDKKIKFCGLNVRQFNDTIPIEFFSLYDISKEELIIKHEIEGLQWLEANNSNRVLSSIFGYEDKRLTWTLSSPHINSTDVRNYFNFYFKCERELKTDIITIRNSSPIIKLQQNLKKKPVDLILREGEETVIPLKKDTTISTECLGESYAYVVGIRILNIGQKTGTIKAKFFQNSVIFFKDGKAVDYAEIGIFILSIPGFNFFSSLKSMSLHPSDLALVAYEPYTPRILNIMACCISSISDIPIAIPPKVVPAQKMPNIILGGSFLKFEQKDGWIFNKDKGHRELFKNLKKVFLFGRVSVDFFLGMISSGKYMVVGLVTDDNKLLYNILNEINEEPINLKQNEIYCNVKNEINYYLMYCPDISRSARSIEDMFIKIHNDNDGTSFSSIYKDSILYSYKNRLPSLPYCSDLAIGAISIVGNILRGRAPIDKNDLTPQYNIYSNEKLWIAPWNNNECYDHQSLIVELNVRNVSEFLAVRAFVELLGDLWIIEKGTINGNIPVLAEKKICSSFKNWLSWGNIGIEDKKKQRRDLKKFLKENQISPVNTFKIIGNAAYEACYNKGSFKFLNPRKKQLSQSNPFVIACAYGGKEVHDFKLSLDIPFWSLYTAKMSANKPGALVPNLLSFSTFAEGLSIQANLRLALHKEPLTEDDIKLVYELRQQLSEFLLKIIEPATFKLLKLLEADRIVIFSELNLEFLPCHQTILGLEYPVCRYPTEIPAFTLISRIAANSIRERNIFNKKYQASILCAREADDPTTIWAKQISNEISSAFEIVGCKAIVATDEALTKNKLLSIIEDTPIVTFIGHAVASDTWAGLSFGDYYISNKEIFEIDWSGSFVFLIGCETAAIDAKGGGNIGEIILSLGARAVIGTTAKISVDVAEVFFNELLLRLIKGLSADYSFFIAKRKAVIFEIIKKTLKVEHQAKETVNSIFESLNENENKSMETLLKRFGVTWQKIEKDLIYSLTLTLLGGAGERLI